MRVGVPKEITMQENRVSLVPSAVATLIAHGHRVLVEREAGLRSKYSDHDYSETGAHIVYSAEEVYKADIIIKVAPPTLDEIDLMHPNQILISPLQLPIISSDGTAMPIRSPRTRRSAADRGSARPRGISPA